MHRCVFACTRRRRESPMRYTSRLSAISKFLEREIALCGKCFRRCELFFERMEIAGEGNHDGVVGSELGWGNQQLAACSLKLAGCIQLLPDVFICRYSSSH